jgi:AICAR transformylase/IMP cyclohydrolase PurH
MIRLKYGCNPHQTNATVGVPAGANSPLDLLNGEMLIHDHDIEWSRHLAFAARD